MLSALVPGQTSGSGAVVCSVAPDDDGSMTVAGSGSPSAVGSGSSTLRGDALLGSGPDSVLVRGRTLSRGVWEVNWAMEICPDPEERL